MALVLPNFLVVGAPKAGTTTLHDILMQHPDIYLPEIKELHFFDSDENYQKGISWYGSFFRAHRGERAVGEVTPSYMTYDYVPQRMAECLGTGAKLIFMLRNPADRAYSEYLHNVRRSLLEDIPFEEALKLEFNRKDLHPYEKRTFSFISRGYYAKSIENFLSYFPKKNMLFIVFEEEFREDKKKVLCKIFDFLGVERVDVDTDIRSNEAYCPKSMMLQKIMHTPNVLKSFSRFVFPSFKMRKKMRERISGLNRTHRKPAGMPPELRERLLGEVYAKDIHELTTLIDRDLSCWHS